MQFKSFGSSNFKYTMMLILNPLIILFFQNCSVAKLSDEKIRPNEAQASTLPKVRAPATISPFPTPAK